MCMLNTCLRVLSKLGFWYLLYFTNAEPKIREPLYVIFKDMESKSILGVTSTCSNPCTTPFGHTEDDGVSLLLESSAAIPPEMQTKFLEKYKRPLIFGSAYISRPCLMRYFDSPLASARSKTRGYI